MTSEKDRACRLSLLLFILQLLLSLSSYQYLNILNLCHVETWLLAQVYEWLIWYKLTWFVASTVTCSSSQVKRLITFQFFKYAKVSISPPSLYTCWFFLEDSFLYTLPFLLLDNFYSFFRFLPRRYFLLKVFPSQT